MTYESITDLRWVGLETHQTSSITKPALRASVNEKTGSYAVVSDGHRSVQVGAVLPTYAQADVRTHVAGVWTDNLLALPTS